MTHTLPWSESECSHLYFHLALFQDLCLRTKLMFTMIRILRCSSKLLLSLRRRKEGRMGKEGGREEDEKRERRGVWFKQFLTLVMVYLGQYLCV